MTEPLRKSRFSRFGRWIAELLLVFIGVYAAFWLNSYQERQRDVKRRDVILDSLEESVKEAVDNAHQNSVFQEQRAREFRRALEAGEMPLIRPFSIVADYSPTDTATLLQAGGVELLDPKTLAALRNTESVIRGGLALMARFEKVSDQLILPNLDKGNAFFYDPATKKLHPSVERYPEGLDAGHKILSRHGKIRAKTLAATAGRTPAPLNFPSYFLVLISYFAL
jgi:hypothetical protein